MSIRIGSILMRKLILTESGNDKVSQIHRGASLYTKQYSDDNPDKTEEELSEFNKKITKLIFTLDALISNDHELAAELQLTSGITQIFGKKFKYKGHTGYRAFFAALHLVPMSKIRAISRRLAAEPPDDEEDPGWDSIIPDEYIVYQHDGIVIIQGASEKITQKIARYVDKDAYCIAYTSKNRENVYNKYRKQTDRNEIARGMPYFIFNYNEPNTGGKFANYHLSVLYKFESYRKDTNEIENTAYTITRGDNREQLENLSISEVVSLYNKNWSNSNANFLKSLYLPTTDPLYTTPDYVNTMREYYIDFVDKGTHYECTDVVLDGDKFFDWRLHLDKYGTGGYD